MFSARFLSLALLLTTCAAPLNSQSYDPASDKSPLTLLQAPADGFGYHLLRERAEALYKAEKWAEAEPLAEKIAREYPRDGDNWLLLGSIKENLKKYEEAAAANERAGTLLGSGLTEVPFFRAANNHLKAGNKRAALDLLRREVFERRLILRSQLYNFDELASLRSDPEFLEIVGRLDSSKWSRDYGWRQDIKFLRDEVKRVNPDYHSSPLPVDFEQRYQDLIQNVPNLTDEQLFVGMNSILATLRQGHTGLWAAQDSRIAAKRLPFQIWAFPEGIYIVDAIDKYRHLIGSRLVNIEGVAAQEVLKLANKTQSVDGDNEYLLLGTQRMRHTPYLVGLGVAKSADSVRVTVQKTGERARTITVGTPPSDFALSLVAAPNVDTPLYLRDVKQLHWDVAMPEYDAFYVQLNGIADEEKETLAQYGQRLRGSLVKSNPKNLILDLRHNGGGSTGNYPELLRTIIGFSQLPNKRVYVLMGRLTYSAAANLVTDLERLADPIFVGEASSECCSLYGDPATFRLPYSKLAAQVSAVKWNLSRNVFDGRREMSPKVPVILTAKDHFAGRDPGLDTILRLIAHDKQK